MRRPDRGCTWPAHILLLGLAMLLAGCDNIQSLHLLWNT